MSSGLLALVDDVAGLAKLAAASLDDIGAKAAKAGAKAAGVVIDDAAVTPRYMVGFAASRELPMIWRIARGSLKNKLLFLLPAALALSAFAPSLITPLLMLGGAYLCYEGAEKVLEALGLTHHHVTPVAVAADPVAEENARVTGAIRTDFILSAEIMALALSTLPEGTLLEQAVVLAVVALGITVFVYGAVALIVKADDAGVALAAGGRPVLAPLGRSIVQAMPGLLKALSVVGTLAMLWVGGGIMLHGLGEFGLAWPGHALHSWGTAIGGGVQGWLLEAAGAGVLGLALGSLVLGAMRAAGR
jgi:uncharacterized protein